MADENQDVLLGIDLWIDLNSCGCYLTLVPLRKALADAKIGQSFQLVLHPFFDQPGSDDSATVQDLAQSLGINLAEDLPQADTTRPAWRLLAHAQQLDYAAGTTGPEALHLRLAEALLRGHYELALDITDLDILIGIGQDVGMGAEEIREAVESEAMEAIVEEGHTLALYLGVEQVPLVLIDEQYVAPGLQTPENYVTILEAAQREHPAESEAH